MNLASLFGPILQKLLLPPLQKAGLWAARQTLGKTQGNAAAPIVDTLAGVAAQDLSQDLSKVATTHLTNDKLAQQIGIPTTEQGLVSAAQSVIGGTSTLDLSHQSLLANFLQQSIVKAAGPTNWGN